MGRSLRLPVKSATVQRKATRPGQGRRGVTRDWQPPLLPSHRHRAEPRRRPKPRGRRALQGVVSIRNHLHFPIVVDPWGSGFGSRYGDRDGHSAGEMPPLRRLAHGREFFEAEFGAARNTVKVCAVPPSGGRSVATGGKRRAPLRNPAYSATRSEMR
jgi:hypothetical protein